MLFARLLLLVAVLLASAPAHAAGKVALVIANAGYRNVPQLPNPPADAALMARSLKAAGFTQVDIAQNLDKVGLEAALQAFGEKADRADVALIYYAGHGIEVAGRNYLVPVSARLLRDRDAELEAVSLDTVLSVTEGARMRVVLLDACRENPFANQMARTGAGRSVGRGLARVEPAGDTLIVYAAKAGAIAADGDGANSPFATALARRIVEPGVEISFVFRRVRDDVLAATSQRQEPFIYGSLSGAETYLVPPNGRPAPVAIDAEALSWQGALLANSASGFNDYLKRYPAGSYAALARANLDRLRGAGSSTPPAGQRVPALAVPSIAQTMTGAKFGDFGVDLSARGVGITPGSDFWGYVNGGWSQSTVIPAGRTSVGVFTQLSDQAEAQLLAILDEAVAGSPAMGANGRKLGDYFASFTDEAAIERAGTAPLAPYLARVDAATDRAALQRLFMVPGYASPIDMGAMPDPANPARNVLAFGQGRLGINRDYLVEPGTRFDTVRASYRSFIERMLSLAGVADAASRATGVFALETAMAKAQWTTAQMRDDAANSQVMDASQRRALAPQFDWDAMLRAVNLGTVQTAVMGQPGALTALGTVFADTPVTTWQDWLKFRFVADHAAMLPTAFDQAYFDFYGRVLNNQTIPKSRRARGLQAINGALGEALGEQYVRRHYSAETGAKVTELVGDLKAAFQARIAESDWMDAGTRAAALAKLARLELRVGHPAQWTDYSALTIRRGEPLANAMRASDFSLNRDIARVGRPTERDSWAMTPQTINAYYSPLENQIVFPAAILQAPFFDPKADAAVNYGAIGSVMAHELSHAFDDSGGNYGPDGSMRTWWSPATRTAYGMRTARLTAQFGQYEPVPGVRVDGARTQGENVGDLAGLEIAYAAYRAYLGRHGAAPVLNGTTGDQRFFLAQAQAWRTKMTDANLRSRLQTGPHSPPQYRVNGIIRNMDAWYAAFGIRPGDPLYLAPEQRVHIW